MKNQLLLDKLGSKTKIERLKAIKENADYILGDEFLSFLKGQTEYLESIENDTVIFDRIYVGEDTSFLDFMKSEMRKHGEIVHKVWNSIEMFSQQNDVKLLLKTSMANILGNSPYQNAAEDLPCGQCSELVRSHGLCTGCLSGKIPKQVLESLQKKYPISASDHEPVTSDSIAKRPLHYD